MKRTILIALMALMGTVTYAQDVLSVKVAPADESKGISARYLYTNGSVVFTLQEKDGEMGVTTLFIAPDGKKFGSSKMHICNVELHAADGSLLKSVKYFTWVQGKNDRLLFYEDAIFGYHANHASSNGKCDCYTRENVFTNIDLWNFVCDQDGYVTLKSETKDGEEVTTSFWCIQHKN